MSSRDGSPSVRNGQSAVLTWRDLHFENDDANVYAPKPASLLLAEEAVKRISEGSRVLDACTGSGVVGIAVARYVKRSVVIVSDVNEAALAASTRNAARNEVRVEVLFSSLYDAIAPNSLDVITVHPPAVPYPEGDDWGLSEGMRVATNGGSDGSVLVLRAIAEAAPKLRPGGRLLLLLPHWSNVPAARAELARHFQHVEERARKDVDFFPVMEGTPRPKLLEHLKRLAAKGLIEMTFDQAVPRSVVSVVESWSHA